MSAASKILPSPSACIHLGCGIRAEWTGTNREVSSALMAQVGMWNGPGCKFLNSRSAEIRRSRMLSHLLADRPRATAPSRTLESRPTPNFELASTNLTNRWKASASR